jgi:hypothetical protein
VRPSLISDKEESFGLWYELGGLYARAGEDVRRAVREGFVAVFVVAALLLVSSAPLGDLLGGAFRGGHPGSRGAALRRRLFRVAAPRVR